MDLFIDTKVLLSFYHLSSDDLEELRKLSVLLDQKRVTMYLPEQVLNEFYRNRDNKIADALNRFRTDQFNTQFPQICKEYDEYSKLRSLIKSYQEMKNSLLEKLNRDFRNENLKADSIIRELFSRARQIPISRKLVSRAKLRYDIGNPPGKDRSYGDAINWESLLDVVPEGEDLYFISDDRDYYAESNKDDFSFFLSKEWADKKHSKIIAHRRLSEFFRDKFPHIKLARELEKELLIDDLTNSRSFAGTKRTLRKLVKISDFSGAQLNDIVAAAITNNQIYWILQDKDVSEKIKALIEEHESQIDPENLDTLYHQLYPSEDEDEFDPDDVTY